MPSASPRVAPGTELTLGNRGEVKRRVHARVHARTHARAPLPPRPAPSLPFPPLPPPSPPPPPQGIRPNLPFTSSDNVFFFPSVLSISGFAREPRCTIIRGTVIRSFDEGLTTTGWVPRYIVPISFSILSEHRRLF
jgi:hypothetical protein